MPKNNKNPDIFIKSYGCAANRFQAQQLTFALENSFSIYNQYFGDDRDFFRDPQERRLAFKAKVFIIYACPITAYLEKFVKNFLFYIRRVNKGALIILSGCSLSYPSSLLPEAKIKGLRNILFMREEGIAGYLRKTLASSNKPVYHNTLNSGIILIENGCNNYCRYCICPCLRKNRNVSFSEIKKQISQLELRGIKRIEFGGPCMGGWHDPRNKHFTFTQLLEFILAQTNLEVFYLEFYPNDLSDKLMELILNGKINKEISVPIQSASDRILKMMRRKYDSAYLRMLFNKLCRKVRNLRLTTDIIVGFPGETKDDLVQTLDFLKRFSFSRVDVYPYSATKKACGVELKNNLDLFNKSLRLKKYKDLRKVIDITGLGFDA